MAAVAPYLESPGSLLSEEEKACILLGQASSVLASLFPDSLFSPRSPREAPQEGAGNGQAAARAHPEDPSQRQAAALREILASAAGLRPFEDG